MPLPYLLQVFSRPTKVDDKLWVQWYTEEHIRDLVYFNASKTASFYKVIAGPDGVVEDDSTEGDFAGEDKTYYAIYQAEKAHPLTTLEYTTRVREESELFNGESCQANGAFEPMDLELTATLGAEGKEAVAPFVVQIEARRDNGRHLNSWVVREHAETVKKIKGYRRTLVYRPNTGEGYGAAEGSGHSIVIDEFDDLAKDDFETLEEELESTAAERQVNFKARALKLIESEGFDGKPREPLRLREEQ